MTLLAVVIMAMLFSVAGTFFMSSQKEMDITMMSLKANRARQAAIAGTRLAAGLAVKNASAATEHLGQNWYLVTTQWDGTSVPYTLDSTKGVYFEVFVMDLSGKFKLNSSNTTTSKAMMRWAVQSATYNDDVVDRKFFTNSELASVSGIGDNDASFVTTYGSDYSMNINTMDQMETLVSGNPPYFSSALLKMTMTALQANTRSRIIIRTRRGAVGNDLNTYDDPDYDGNPQGVYTSLDGDVTYAGSWKEALSMSTNPLTNSTLWLSRANDASKTYGRLTSEGYFLIWSKGYVVKDPSSGSGGTRAAEHTVLRVIKRTSTGYHDCANREWFMERRDIDPYFVANQYDFENTYFLYDAN